MYDAGIWILDSGCGAVKEGENMCLHMLWLEWLQFPLLQWLSATLGHVRCN